ncbi:MAG: hypothetical protein ABSG90_12710 [Dehalococcoidia bacterium]|jgi:hypothetical protein
MELTATNMAGLFSGMGLAGGTVGAVAQYKKGQAESAAYDYNANVALEKMREESEASTAKFSNLMGRQRSLYAKAGVDITKGSPLLILADTAMQAEEEQERIKYAGETSATLQKYYGDVASYAGTTGAMGTFLTSIGRAGLGYAAAQKGINSPWIG